MVRMEGTKSETRLGMNSNGSFKDMEKLGKSGMIEN